MAIDPGVLAALASALTLLATEAAKGAASEAGKSIWAKLRTRLGWTSDPPPDKLKQEVEKQLAANPELAAEVFQLLRNNPTEAAAKLVGHIDAEKVVVAGTINTDSFKM